MSGPFGKSPVLAICLLCLLLAAPGLPVVLDASAAGPDLTELGVSDPPATSVPGTTFFVSDTVQNIGDVKVGTSITNYFIDPKSGGNAASFTSLSVSAIFLKSRLVPSLAVNATSSATGTVKIPVGTGLGDYWLVACADGANAYAEADENNNCAGSAHPVTVVAAGGGGGGTADLTELAVSDPPATSVPGTSFFVSDTVQNIGTANVGSSVTNYFIDAKSGANAASFTTLSGGAIFLKSRLVPSLAVNATSSATSTVKIPLGTALGDYWLVACADGANAYAELSELNNCAGSAHPVTVVTAGGGGGGGTADLVVSSVSNPPAVAVAQRHRGVFISNSFFVSDVTTNQGTAAAPNSYTSYYLSDTNATNPISVNARLLKSRLVPRLGPGAASSWTGTVTVPPDTVAGNYYLVVCADSSGAVPEGDETNNCTASATQVNIQ